MVKLNQTPKQAALDLTTSEDEKVLTLKALKVEQPIGRFFIASINFKDLLKICHFDVRQLVKGETIEEYIGFQRKVKPQRTDVIKQFVELPDASFPTSIVISIDEPYVDIKEEKGGVVTLNISNKPFQDGCDPILYSSLARVLDGQHRLKGLDLSEHQDFDLSVTIFVGMDIADQSMVFANVNLSQTKVNPSLAYDLQALSKHHSPLRFAHRMVVALNTVEKSPFHQMIKRLGTKTPGVEGETLSQATFVNMIVDLVTTKNSLMKDISSGKKNSSIWGGKPSAPIIDDPDNKLTLRPFYIQQDEVGAANLIINYFEAIKENWSDVWKKNETGWVIKRNNGFRAFMKLLPFIYKHISNNQQQIISKDAFLKVFEKIEVDQKIFHTDKAKPGQGGENFIFNTLKDELDKLK